MYNENGDGDDENRVDYLDCSQAYRYEAARLHRVRQFVSALSVSFFPFPAFRVSHRFSFVFVQAETRARLAFPRAAVRKTRLENNFKADYDPVVRGSLSFDWLA